MSRRLLGKNDVRAEWRIDVDDTKRLCSFDVALDGRTHRLTAEATRALRDTLTELLETADRFAAQAAARAAQNGD